MTAPRKAPDLSLLVRMANYAAANSGRQWTGSTFQARATCAAKTTATTAHWQIWKSATHGST